MTSVENLLRSEGRSQREVKTNPTAVVVEEEVVVVVAAETVKCKRASRPWKPTWGFGGCETPDVRTYPTI